jgi:membrane fusion protein (multidrug efflux system)
MSTAASPNISALADAAPRARKRNRQRAFAAILAVVSTAAAAYGGYWFLYGRSHVGTDDAYVGGNVVQVTPQIEGTVVAVNADDTRLVEAGETLVRLDPADTDVKLASVEAELADAVRSVRGLYASSAQAQAGIAQREADQRRAQSDLAAAEAEVEKARAEFRRREALAQQNFVSQENVLTAKTALDAALAQRDAARAAVAQAQAAIAAARQQLRAAAGLVDNTSLEEHPRVRAAAAKVKEAYLDRERVAIRAPVTGYVAKRSVQVGQRVAPGTALMAVVPGDQMWVDANFKEGELKDVRIGQPVRLVSDLYGGDVVYHGHVAGLGLGTGSAFALLPAQNASGNWIKIVQRVPVRVALDPAELRAHPLRIGLSVNVTVDTSDRTGNVLAMHADDGPRYETSVYAEQAKAADALIAKIIAENLGRPAT